MLRALPFARRLVGVLLEDVTQNTYKFALLRALADISATSTLPVEPNVNGRFGVTVPFEAIGNFWIAYYWPFIGQSPEDGDVLQGSPGEGKSDMVFREELRIFKFQVGGTPSPDGRTDPSGGYFATTAIGETSSIPIPKELRSKLAKGIQMPLKHARGGGDLLFPDVDRDGVFIELQDWEELASMRTWIEALAIIRWAEKLVSLTPGGTGSGKRRRQGELVELMMRRPVLERESTTWVREIWRKMAGDSVTCAWTGRRLRLGDAHIDHLFPWSVCPIGELWNLVPVDAPTNLKKRDKLPSDVHLDLLRKHLPSIYSTYLQDRRGEQVLRDAWKHRFAESGPPTAEGLTLATSRLLARYRDLSGHPTF